MALGRQVREALDQMKSGRPQNEFVSAGCTSMIIGALLPSFKNSKRSLEPCSSQGLLESGTQFRITRFLTLTPAICGATNRCKRSSLVVSLLSNCQNATRE